MAEGGSTTAGSAAGVGSQSPPKQDDGADANAAFECNICLDTAKDAVVSYCGHLFW